MTFCGNFNELQSAAETLNKQSNDLAHESWKLKEFVEMLRLLLNSWKNADNSATNTLLFFVDETLTRVVARKLLPPNTKICRTPAEYRAYRETKSFYLSPNTKVPPCYPVVYFDQVAKRVCPACKALQPVCHLYKKTCDVYRDEHLILCFNCHVVNSIKTVKRTVEELPKHRRP